MGMFDLGREDSKYPGWDFLIGIFGTFLFFWALLFALVFSSLGQWFLQWTPDYVSVVKITFWTAIKTSWFYFVLMALGLFLAPFGIEGNYGITSIINKIFYIRLFFERGKTQRIILFSFSLVLWVITMFMFFAMTPKEKFFEYFYQFDFFTLFYFAMTMIGVSMTFVATFSRDDILFKKLWYSKRRDQRFQEMQYFLKKYCK